MTDLMLHRGGWNATKADLASVEVPDATASYVPVPHGRFLEEIELHVPRFGLAIVKSEYALARDGQQMFAVLHCENGTASTKYRLAIGARNSYDRSLAAEIVVGSVVFVCDNLSFSGEVKTKRKHTANVFRDLPDLIYQMLSQVSVMRQRMDTEFSAMEARSLDRTTENHLLLESVRDGAIPASKLPKVIEAYDTSPHFAPGNAWSLYNAFTEVQKQRSPQAQMDDTLRLTNTFRRVLTLS
jgi:hypothetical protein